jgi:predicted dehydrogenase
MEEMMKEQMYTTFDISHHVGETLILQQNLSGIARIVFSSRRKSQHWHQRYVEFKASKGVIRIRISRKNRRHNDQKKMDKRTNNDLQNTTRERTNVHYF